MKQSLLFGHTSKTVPADEVSVNAQLLIRAGFIDKLMSGVYTFLPLGVLILKRIENIIREEIDAIGGQEIFMPALHPKANWERTGRWKDPGREVMFQLVGRADREYGLGWTHEEVVTPLAKRYIASYKDLPRALYQIQTKFRDEPRAKSGLLRGREFIMKDLYSFHADEKDLADYYVRVSDAYGKIFKRLGLNARITEASGGVFAQYSHEFQVPTPAGEDIVVLCQSCDFARNREIAKHSGGDPCPKCAAQLESVRAIEVANIFELKARFSAAFNLTYKDSSGKEQPVLMGCYGIGIGRLMGAIVEVHHDEQGICWPTAVAPYDIHLLALGSKTKIRTEADTLCRVLQKKGLRVLYDDRGEVSPGEKLADADLIGIPRRIILSEKTLLKRQFEIKSRSGTKPQFFQIANAAKSVAQFSS